MSDAKVLGRDILGRKENARRKTIPIAEWGGDVVIRQLSARQVSAIQGLASEAVDSGKGQVRDRAKLSRFNFAMIRDSWISAEGEQVLTDADYDVLVDEPHSVISTLVSEISDFNNMGDQAQAQAKKNSAVTQNGASGTS
jgi:hypothetical protein